MSMTESDDKKKAAPGEGQPQHERQDKSTDFLNIYNQVGNFFDLNFEHPFTGNETKLYFFLLDRCNKLRWKNPFPTSLRTAANGSRICLRMVKTAIEGLEKRGLINVQVGRQGNRYDAENTTRIFIVPAKNQNGHLPVAINATGDDLPVEKNATDNDLPVEAPVEKNATGDLFTSGGTSGENLHSINTKTKEKNTNKKESGKKRIFPPTREEIQIVFEDIKKRESLNFDVAYEVRDLHNHYTLKDWKYGNKTIRADQLPALVDKWINKMDQFKWRQPFPTNNKPTNGKPGRVELATADEHKADDYSKLFDDMNFPT
jgi:hypothetical protein